MDATRLHRALKLFLIAGAFIGCWIDPAPDSFPSNRETLRSIGRRLSRSWSERDLTAIASRADLVLERLRPNERIALARGYLHFRVDSPVLLDVAMPAGSIPFWIADLGFRPTDLTLAASDTRWRVFEKAFPIGSIGLGVNNLDRTPEAHYVVFIRPLAPEVSPRRQPRIELAASQARLWKTTIARPHVSAAHDVYRPFTRMSSQLIGSILLQASDAERHSAVLATNRVWKTRVPSTALPSQVTVSFGKDAARELVWTWTTCREVESSCIRLVPARAVAERERAADGGDGVGEGARVVTGESTCIEVPNLLNDPIVRRHTVSVDRLEPDTAYRYSLGDGTPGRWGSWHTVKTSPAASRGPRFLYLGDAQTGLERWGRQLQTAFRRHPGIDFILMAGDLVDRGNERTNWDHFFLRAAGVFDSVPLSPCAGNHEYLDRGPWLYRAFFELPRNGPTGIDPDLVYHFESGTGFFAVLDSTLAVCDKEQAARQAAWLDAVLEQTRATWKFVLFHHPVYPSHPWRDSPVLREHWVPVFDKHHVDFVLQGHDHAYLRTYPLRGHRRAEPENGTTYLVAVSGDKYVDQPHRDYIAVGFTDVSTYQTFDIDEQTRRLHYRAWTEDGKVVDELIVDKTARSRIPAPPQKLVSGHMGAGPLEPRSQNSP